MKFNLDEIYEPCYSVTRLLVTVDVPRCRDEVIRRCLTRGLTCSTPRCVMPRAEKAGSIRSTRNIQGLAGPNH